MLYAYDESRTTQKNVVVVFLKSHELCMSFAWRELFVLQEKLAQSCFCKQRLYHVNQPLEDTNFFVEVLVVINMSVLYCILLYGWRRM